MGKKSFKGGGMPNMNDLMKQAQLVQQNMDKARLEMEQNTTTATSGGGVVSTTVSGKMRLECLNIKLNEIISVDKEFSSEFIKKIEDRIIATANEALDKVSKDVTDETNRVTNDLLGDLNMKNLMKKSQQIQESLGKMQDDIKGRTAKVSSSDEAITVVASGDSRIQELTIAANAISDNVENFDDIADDIEMLQDLLIAGINEALRNMEEEINSKMNSITGGMLGGMPGQFLS